jgi:hypothetical protein
MKAIYRTKDNRISFELTGETPKELFKAISNIQEVFEAESSCGCCQGTVLQYRVREDNDGNEYYELACLHCYAKFSFGQNKKGGGLFAKRYDKDHNRIENNGWRKWEKKQGATNSAPQRQETDDSLPF